MSVPNRAEHPNRKVAPATHYAVSYNKPTGELHDSPSAPGGKVAGTANDTRYFSDKKSAKTYGKGVAKLGYDVYAEKHDATSQAAGYTKGKTAKLMEAGFATTKFMKGM
jgi:hypothetical protein